MRHFNAFKNEQNPLPHRVELRVLLLLVIFLAIPGRIAPAQGQPTLPAFGWQGVTLRVDGPAGVTSYVARNQAVTKSVLVESRPIPVDYPTLEAFSNAWARQFTRGAGSVVSQGFTTCGGVPAFQATILTRGQGGQELMGLGIVLFAGGRVYEITMSSAVMPIAQDPDFRTILQSFRFVR